MSGSASLRPETILAFIPGGIAFSPDMGAGVPLRKLTSVLSGRKINPMALACGISAFPMSSGGVQKRGLQADPHNHLLMHRVGTNTAGQSASVMAGEGMLLLVPMFS